MLETAPLNSNHITNESALPDWGLSWHRLERAQIIRGVREGSGQLGFCRARRA